MFFKARAGDRVFELANLTLGDMAIMRKHFSLSRMSEFSADDPDHLRGCIYLCVKREKPGQSHDAILAEVDALDLEDFAQADADEETDETDPTSEGAADVASSVAPSS